MDIKRGTLRRLETVTVSNMIGDSPMSANSVFSVERAFDGATVFLTGGTGYIGSLVMEQLLRCCPGIDKIYVLARSRNGLSIQARFRKLLGSGLFNRVRDHPDLLDKVVPIEGDITLPQLGLKDEDLVTLRNEATYVIHCAADITLEANIKVTLRRNYVATLQLMKIVSLWSKVQAVVHVSSAYVNANLPKKSTVEERIYPLCWGDAMAPHHEIVEELLSMPDKDAELKAAVLMKMWNFPCTYTFGKHLAEQMVCGFHHRPFPVVIVRPTFVGALAGAPYPGYVGNYAGPTGYSLGLGLGFANRNSLLWEVDSVIDTIPGDYCSSTIVVAAAATACKILSSDPQRLPDIVHASTSTSYPLICIVGHRFVRRFFKNHPFPITFAPFGMPKESLKYKPIMWKGKTAMCFTACKVKLASSLLKLLGKERQAKKLTIGFVQWSFANHPDNDFSMYFSNQAARMLTQLLGKSEQEAFPMIWSSERGSWERYYNTYLAAISRTMFNKDIDPKVTPHDFVLVPSEKLD